MNTTSEKSQHTPGPWAISQRPDKSVEVQQSSSVPVCVLCYRNDGRHLTNAHLISAAPDLLQACRMALVQVKQDNDERKAEHRLTQYQLEAAITKATTL